MITHLTIHELDYTIDNQTILSKLNEIIDVVNNFKKIKPLLEIKVSVETRETFSQVFHDSYENLVKSFPDYNILLLYDGYSKPEKFNVKLHGLEMEKSDFDMFRNSVLESLEKFNEYLNEDTNELRKLLNTPLKTNQEIFLENNKDKFYLNSDGKIIILEQDNLPMHYLNDKLPTEIYNSIASFLYSLGNNITNDENVIADHNVFNEQTEFSHDIEFKLNFKSSGLLKDIVENIVRNVNNEYITFKDNSVIVKKEYYNNAK